MSLELSVLLPSDRLPSVHEWQAAIDSLPFPLQLDPELDIRENVGFVPCKLAGEESGFELYLDQASDLVGSYPHIEAAVAGRDVAVSFRWGGDMSECACVVAAAAALVKGFGGLAYDPQDDEFYDGDRLLSEARTIVGDAG